MCYLKRGFAGVIKLRMLRWEDDPELSLQVLVIILEGRKVRDRDVIIKNRDEKEGKKERFKDAMLLTLKMEEEATH